MFMTSSFALQSQFRLYVTSQTSFLAVFKSLVRFGANGPVKAFV